MGGASKDRELVLSPWLAKAIAGTSSGIIATAVCSPLDVAKTRIQVQSSSAAASTKYSGVIEALMTIYRQEGVLGWYSGFTPAVCSVAVFWMVYFPCYDYFKDHIAHFFNVLPSLPVVHLTAAGCAGFVTDIITNPLWVVRTRLATQSLLLTQGLVQAEAGAEPAMTKPLYTSMRHCFQRIASEEGPLAFFSGLSASLLGLSHIMIQFPLYERLKAELSRDQQFRRQGVHSFNAAQGRPDASNSVNACQHSQPHAQMGHIIAASAISKFVASTITYPHEVIRARLQFDHGGKLYAGLLDATIKTFRAEGVLGFWLGFRLNIARTVPQAVVTFTIYEQLSKSLQGYTWSRREPMLGLGTCDAASEHCTKAQQSNNPESTVRLIARTRSENRG